MATTLAPDELQEKRTWSTNIQSHPCFKQMWVATRSLGKFRENRQFYCPATVGLCVCWKSEHPSTQPPSQRWHYRLQVKRNKGIFPALQTPYFSLFTYYRVWDASSPRSVATTGRRWRDFAADRRRDPWPRSNTTNSCWSWFYSPSTNAPPSRAAPRDTHPRAVYAVRRSLELVRLRQLFKKDANQGQLIPAGARRKSAARDEKTRIIYRDTKAAAEARLVETADARVKYAGTPPPTAQLTRFCIKYSEDGEDVD